MSFCSTNPATGEEGAVWPLHGAKEREQIVARAQCAQRAWAATLVGHRSVVLRTIADLLDERVDALAERMALEMGKVQAEGRAEVLKCAWVCRYYADNAEKQLSARPVEASGTQAWVQYDPMGLLLAIMPWNFPLWQVVRCAAPALAAGNGVLLKHAPNVQGCADDIERLMIDAGLPPGVFANLRLPVDEIPSLIADRRVAAVTLTGSTRAGRSVAETAGRHLKPTLLELGGCDAFLVLSDADVSGAVAAGTLSRMLNAGQSCIASKRFIVVEAVAEAFINGLRGAIGKIVVGDPRAPETTMGPLARPDLANNLRRQVADSVKAGAIVDVQAPVPQGDCYFPPTLLLNISPGQPAWDDELFGPVAAVCVVPDDETAWHVANHPTFGLAGAVWTADTTKAAEMARRMQCGAVFFNGLAHSDPRLPFGGVADSGWGRELSDEGILAFVNRKTVWVK
ncbi:MAG: aldehyde dehydrogenase family protein [Rhodobacterales bacterium]|nr:aldehyde dehydrogenase family protein [Rhodobacterales bacterium]